MHTTDLMFRTSKLVLVLVLIGTTLRGSQFGQMNFAYWQTPVSGVVASGGTQATPANGYNQWSFLTTGSNTFTVTTGGTVYYAIVAGGAGGGNGGGGGGGVITGQTTLTAGTYTIVVGTGGTAGYVSGSYTTFVSSTNGGNSSAFGFTAVGGGGSYVPNAAPRNAFSGGSGGGATADGGTVWSGGVGVAGQGWAGSSNINASPYPAGAGGGAGGIAGACSGSNSGSGGLGLSVYLPVSATTVYYGGGGGGGGGTYGAVAGSGGTGGGGGGGTSGSVNGVNGTANTGGGGGGCYNNGNSSGGNGGSGIVVIWSPIATPAKTPYVQYLVTAGGGGSPSGAGSAGGGGAGGVLQGLFQPTAGTTYTITVGTGGAGSTSQSSNGGNGVDSQISGSGLTTIDAVGGGGGGHGNNSGANAGSSGGSGGGGGSSQVSGIAGGAGTTSQGYAGGTSSALGGSYSEGAGGGGRGFVGVSSGTGIGGNGGDGFTTYIANPATYSWSNHFNSNTTDYLSVPSNTAFAFGTGAFTVELWAYFTSSGSNIGIIDTGNSTGINIRETGTNALMVYSRAGSATICTTGSNVFSLNTWTHIALVRNGTTDTLYVNGVSQATGSDSNSYGSAGALIVGVFMDAISSAYCINGYLSNLRIVKGTAVYTSGFTPSTTPLTAISGTSLLTCQAGSFSDSSSNNFTVTASGSPYIASQNPFGASYAGGGGGGGWYTGSTVGNGGMGGGAGGGGYNTAGVGSGGGGNGSQNAGPSTGGNGGTNTGGGGGGGTNGGTGGNGGSGVVILAYPSTYPAASSTTGSPTVTTSGGFRVYTFTGGGTITF